MAVIRDSELRKMLCIFLGEASQGAADSGSVWVASLSLAMTGMFAGAGE
jgi:hypothetical protein